MIRRTISLSPELHELIASRAELNTRSFNGEVNHLLELAVYSEVPKNMEIMRLIQFFSDNGTINPVP